MGWNGGRGALGPHPLPLPRVQMLVLLLYMAVWWKETIDPPPLPSIICVTLGRSLSSLSVSVSSSGKWRQYLQQLLLIPPLSSPGSEGLSLDHVLEPPKTCYKTGRWVPLLIE